MAKLLGLLLAVTAGVATALLLAAGVSVENDGRTVSCSSVIGAAAIDGNYLCADALTRRAELSAVTGLLCVAGGTIVAFAGKPAQTNGARTSTGIAVANPTSSTTPNPLR